VDCGFKEFHEKYKNPKSKIQNPKWGKSSLGDLGVGLAGRVGGLLQGILLRQSGTSNDMKN
jgi:hypothetical protein